MCFWGRGAYPTGAHYGCKTASIQGQTLRDVLLGALYLCPVLLSLFLIALLLHADLQAFEILVKHGADVELRAGHGWRPIHLAAIRGSGRVLHFLLEHGADANATDDDGGYSLQHCACVRVHTLSFVQCVHIPTCTLCAYVLYIRNFVDQSLITDDCLSTKSPVLSCPCGLWLSACGLKCYRLDMLRCLVSYLASHLLSRQPRCALGGIARPCGVIGTAGQLSRRCGVDEQSRVVVYACCRLPRSCPMPGGGKKVNF